MKDQFGKDLTRWYKTHKRPLPWRFTRDPYKIWLSEIILQQTRVNQGIEYYEKIITAFPDIYRLAEATQQQVYKLWQGLGYYSRADNLLKTAKKIVKDMNGQFPSSFQALKSLPGIGDYTAAAIASIAFDHPHAAVDGNVYRVLSRIFGIQMPINTAAGKKEFLQLAQQLMEGSHPATFNQALMEFGALQCTPKNPGCDVCIFRSRCFAFLSKKQASLPVKKKKAPSGQRFFYYFVMQHQQNGQTFFYLRKRNDRDIWRNLYDFPARVTPEKLENPLDSLHQLPEIINMPSVSFTTGTPSPLYIQQLTHLKISAWFIPVYLNNFLPDTTKNSLSLIQTNQLSNFPVPRLISRYLQDFNLL